MQFLTENWKFFLLTFFVLEKVVKLTKWKWDDILIDSIKEIIFAARNRKNGSNFGI